jgi:hypothetical protein
MIPRIRGTVLAAMLSAAWAASATASTPSADAFLMLPIDAREVAFGQATIGLVNDATSFHRNPAGQGRIRSLSASASYSRLYGNLASHQMLALAMPVAGTVSAGVAWVRSGVDGVPRYPSLDLYGTPQEREIYARGGAIGSLNFVQNGLFLTLAKNHELNVDFGWQYLTLPMEVPIGVTLKYLTISAGDTASASGLGLDLGAHSRFSLARAFDNRGLGTVALGATISNVGRTKVTWDTSAKREDVQSMSLRLGVAYEQPIAPIRSMVTFLLADPGNGTAWGVAYTFDQQITLRIGDSGIGEDAVAVGAGFIWKNLEFDYALQRHPLGASHRVSIQYSR